MPERLYEAARGCFGEIQCDDQRSYGNLLLRKGAIETLLRECGSRAPNTGNAEDIATLV